MPSSVTLVHATGLVTGPDDEQHPSPGAHPAPTLLAGCAGLHHAGAAEGPGEDAHHAAADGAPMGTAGAQPLGTGSMALSPSR